MIKKIGMGAAVVAVAGLLAACSSSDPETPSPSAEARGWVAALLLGLIRFYQLAISPWLGRGCRFEPSCSRYAAACIAGHGAAHGSLLSVKRLCKCHPFHPGGYDPPPPPRHIAAASPAVAVLPCTASPDAREGATPGGSAADATQGTPVDSNAIRGEPIPLAHH
jgi:putative membrane protein insertion efficiency factor